MKKSIETYYRQAHVESLSYGIVNSENIYTISEYCVLRELMWLLHEPLTSNTCRVFFRDEDNKFKVHNNVTIPSLPPVSHFSLIS